MSKYRVFVQQTVSTSVEVEADSIDEALDTFFESDDMPGGITVGAFGVKNVDSSGEWEAVAVYDEDNNEVWSVQQPVGEQ